MSEALLVNRYWREIMNTMMDGLMVISRDGTIVMVNAAFSKITGYDREEIIGEPCSKMKCDICCPATGNGIGISCDLLKKGHFQVGKCRIRKKDDLPLSVIRQGRILKDGRGKIMGAVETFTDVSAIDDRDRKIKEMNRILEGESLFCGMAGESGAMKKVYAMIKKAALSEAPVILYGESGTGKELAARAIHQLGPRKDLPFVEVHCAGLNEDLIESEIFGHAKGAFTGAYRSRRGRFETAHGGDIFLDEIGEIPLTVQTKLLRVIENQQFERVGESRSIEVKVRLIAATNRDLKQMVKRRLFRRDLFYRIHVIPVHIPPLRERREDIPLLVNHFIRRLRIRTGKAIDRLSPDAMQIIMKYPWPGNVRELKSAIEYAFVLLDQGEISIKHLYPEIVEATAPEKVKGYLKSEDKGDLERASLINALKISQGNQTHAAKILKVSRVTVWHRMQKYGIDLKKGWMNRI